jgi:tetratricopeptide (TPR) repeat protein
MAQLKAIISSTSFDLPDHRKEMLEACLRQGVQALRMEDLPARDRTAKTASVMLVDQADIYVGIFAHRYGYVPEEDNPDKISVTEMEYNRAVECRIPRLIFIMDEDHPIKIGDIEQGEGAIKLKTFLKRATTDNIVNFFKNPDGLRAEAINSLAQYLRERVEEAERLPESTSPVVDRFHYVSDIPEPPKIYIAHPYTLLQTSELVGRRDELNTLTDWVSRTDSDTYKAHILNVVAIGGMGKSALTWEWFNNIAPEEMKPLAGRMWWSFYESDASFENFVMRALAYVTGRSIEEIRKMPSPEREAELLAALNQEPFLIVLDGLERILIAYTGKDAARLKDSDVDDQKNRRKTIDPRVGQFLKKLTSIKNSRILISTRLYPAELETDGGDAIPNVFRVDLEGLTDDDAILLWRAFGVSGSRDLLQPIFDSIEKHPLLIQALAGEIKRYKKAPGNFEEWHKNNPRFDPARFQRVQDAMGHVMEFSIHKLKEKPRRVLQIIAAFRMPVGYTTLTALLIGDGNAFADELEIDRALVELEDRGLVGWDKRANRYDLHPIVRGVVWSALGDDARQGVYTRLHAHFEALPIIENYLEVNSLEDVTPAIELYNTLIGMERYEDAFIVFRDQLDKATLWRLSANRRRVELLKMLFLDGIDKLPQLRERRDQGYTLNSLAVAYQFSGQPGLAVPLYRRYTDIAREQSDDGNFVIGLENLSDCLQLTGGLRESEGATRRALEITRRLKYHMDEAVSLQYLGLTLSARGEVADSGRALPRALQILRGQEDKQGEGVVSSSLAQRAMWFDEAGEALRFAHRAWEIAHVQRYERDFIRAARLQGQAALALDDLVTGEERLHHALTRARGVNLADEELAALVALAELRRRQGNEKEGREFLDDVWEFAERGPYPLLHADALNVLAQIERDAGNAEEAIKAATKAYQLAWCDGPPYTYHWGLIKAQKHLEELGAPLPDMPPFDESKYEPMPEVEIDPEDEFHVGDSP